MPQPNDTSPEAERVLVDVYRKMSVAQKWRRLGQIYQTAKVLHATGFRSRHPEASEQQTHEDWLRVTLGEFALEPIRSRPVTRDEDSLQVLQEVTAGFTALDIPYALGGSMASSMLGMPRFTEDADISAEPFTGKESALVSHFGPDYYVSLPAVQQAVRQRSSFNIIHTASGFKVDVFIRKDRPFEVSVMARRRSQPLAGRPQQSIVLVSPEDVILLKLEWYRLGNETSDRQWSDILGVLKVQAGKLDEAYLDHWAADLKVTDLLARARRESDL